MVLVSRLGARSEPQTLQLLEGYNKEKNPNRYYYKQLTTDRGG